jgi:hypothetical protein
MLKKFQHDSDIPKVFNFNYGLWFISKDSRIPGLEGGKWKVECGLDHFLPSTFCSLTLDPLNLLLSEDSVRDEWIFR